MTERSTTVSRMAPIAPAHKHKRVAAYARVSSGKDAMLHSLAAQVSYYSELIQRNPQWEYRRTVWRCNSKYEGDKKCSTPHVTQDELEKAFVSVMQRMLQEKTEILTTCRAALDAAFDTTELDRAAKRLQEQELGITERVRKLVEENARVQMNQEEYQQEYNALAEDYEKVSEKLRKIAAQKHDKADRRRKIEIFIRMLERQEECLDFDPYTFVALVDKVVIGEDKKLKFCFRNGMQYFSSLDGVHAQ